MATQKVNTMSEFNSLIRDWMQKEGWDECYKINHPTETKNEVHFIKGSIRCICVKNEQNEYAYIFSDTIFGLPRDISLKSKSFAIGDTGELLLNSFWIQLNMTVIKNNWKEVK